MFLRIPAANHFATGRQRGGPRAVTMHILLDSAGSQAANRLCHTVQTAEIHWFKTKWFPKKDSYRPSDFPKPSPSFLLATPSDAWSGARADQQRTPGSSKSLANQKIAVAVSFSLEPLIHMSSQLLCLFGQGYVRMLCSIKFSSDAHRASTATRQSVLGASS